MQCWKKYQFKEIEDPQIEINRLRNQANLLLMMAELAPEVDTSPDTITLQSPENLSMVTLNQRGAMVQYQDSDVTLRRLTQQGMEITSPSTMRKFQIIKLRKQAQVTKGTGKG